jgi:aerobic-type carbon monoxide dehydrogenase small subunit (CoxS/CutS family)
VHPAGHRRGARRRQRAPSVGSVGNQQIVTIEGLATGEALHPIQQAWIEQDVASCGLLPAGQIMRALALIAANPTRPTPTSTRR